MDQFKEWLQDVSQFQIKLYNIILHSQFQKSCWNISLVYESQLGLSVSSTLETAAAADCKGFLAKGQSEEIDQRLTKFYNGNFNRRLHQIIINRLIGKNMLANLITLIAAIACLLITIMYNFLQSVRPPPHLSEAALIPSDSWFKAANSHLILICLLLAGACSYPRLLPAPRFLVPLPCCRQQNSYFYKVFELMYNMTRSQQKPKVFSTKEKKKFYQTKTEYKINQLE